MELVVDKREPQKLRDRIKRECEVRGVDYKEDVLVVGDYYFPDKGILIERKTISDYISSVKSGHLKGQLLDMKDNQYPFLFIVGVYSREMADPKKRKYIGQFSTDHMIGSLCSFISRYGNVRMVQLENESWFIKALFSLHAAIDKGDVDMIFERHKRNAYRCDINIALLGCIPDMGIKRCLVICERYTFDEIRKLCNEMEYEDVIKLTGFPKKILSKKSYTVLNTL